MKEIEKLIKLGACEESIEWLSSYKNAREAWADCANPDWMFWLLPELPIDIPKVSVRIAVACAKRALKYVPAGEERPANAISLVERWLAGETVTNQELTAADADAYAAAYATRSAAADAAYAARSASYAARSALYALYAADATDAAYAAAYATNAAADATRAAADAARYAVYDAERREQCAIIRAIVSYDTVAELLESSDA